MVSAAVALHDGLQQSAPGCSKLLLLHESLICFPTFPAEEQVIGWAGYGAAVGLGQFGAVWDGAAVQQYGAV